MRHSLAPIPATLAFSAFLVSPAFAAESATATAPTAAPAAAPASGQAKSPEKIEGKLADTTVVATRQTEDTSLPELKAPNRPASLKETPQTATVVTRKVMDERVVTSLRDAVKNSPGLTASSGEGGGSNPQAGDLFVIRGFSAQSDLFVDNLRDTAVYTRDVFATEQVEVTKGTSSVYQGRGSAGGAINLVSKKAVAGSRGTASILANSRQTLRGELDANYDLSKEIESMRGAGVAVRAGAMFQEGNSVRTKEAADDRAGVFASATAGLGRDVTATITHVHYEQNSDGDYGIPYGVAPTLTGVSTPAAMPVNHENWYGVKGQSKDNTVADTTTLDLTLKLDEGVTLNNITRYAVNERDFLFYRPRGNAVVLGGVGIDPVAGTIALDPSSRIQDMETLANRTDLVAKFMTGDFGHTLNVGAEFQRELSTARDRTGTGPLPVVNLYNPGSGATPTQSFALNGSRVRVQAETYAAYVNETLHLSKHIDLVGGLRFDHFVVTRDRRAALPATSEVRDDRDDNLLGWRAGLVLKPTEAVNVYGLVSKTFNPAVNNLAQSVIPANLSEMGPEETLLYEVGTKWDVVKDKLTLGAACFMADRTNIRQNVAPGNVQALTGEAVTRGVELNATGNITERWSLLAGVTFMESEVKKSFVPGEVGKELFNTPNWTAATWTTYKLGAGWDVGLGARYVGDRWADQTDVGRLDNFLVFDGMFGRDLTKDCRVQLNVDNLFDEQYIESARGAGANTATNQGSWAMPGAGRVITASIRMKF